MNVELRSIENAGDLERERVVLRAPGDDDIGNYAIFRCYVTKEKVAAGPIAAGYWFPDRKLKKGDFVVVYSKAGANEREGWRKRHVLFLLLGLNQASVAEVHWGSCSTGTKLETN